VRGRAAGAALVLSMMLPAALAGADSYTPVVLTTTIAPVARLHQPLAIRVAVSADSGVLDTRTAPLRVEVKLASECGGTYQYTPGVVLLNKQLDPQPTAGHAYNAVASGSGKPNAYGPRTVCVWLAEEGDQRVFASDQSIQVNVSKSCTAAATRYDVAEKALKAAMRKDHGVKRARGRAAADHRQALRACGSGVPL
jgi:hypothetical protein